MRERSRDLLIHGRYLALSVEGPLSRHVVAFARTHDDMAAIAVAPRLPLALLDEAEMPLIAPERWRDTHVKLPPELAGRRWRNLLDGTAFASAGIMDVSAILQHFPVALRELAD